MKIDGQLPAPQGIQTRGPALQEEHQVPEVRLSTRTRLVDTLDEWTWFTPGLFYWPGLLQWPQDPIQDWVNEQPDQPMVCRLSFSQPFVLGMPDSQLPGWDWGYGLLGVLNSHWESLYDHLRAIVLYQSQGDFYMRVSPQLVAIPDPLLLTTISVLPDKLPEVPVHFFSLVGNKASLTIEPGMLAPPTPCQVKVSRPHHEVAETAEQLIPLLKLLR